MHSSVRQYSRSGPYRQASIIVPARVHNLLSCMTSSPITVGLVRGADLNPWELQNFVDPSLAVRVFSCQTGYWPHTVALDVRRLPCPEDSLRRAARKAHWFMRRWLGNSEYLIGLGRAAAGSDVLHAAELHNAYSAQAIRARERGRCGSVVVTVWENRLAPSYPNRFVASRVRYVAAQADVILAITQRAAEHARLAGAPDDRIIVQPMGVDIQRFARQHRVPEGTFRVLTVARLVPAKGVEDLVVAVALLHGAGVAVDLTIAGDGPLRARLGQLAARLGIAPHVQFAGTVPHDGIADLYGRADLFVLASGSTPGWQEQFGFALVEAMASGLPVLAGDSGSLREVVGADDALVPPHDPVTLAAAIKNLANDRERCQQQGARNRARAAERFDSRKVAPALVAIYRHALEAQLP
jgi:starch synthase